MVHLPLTRDLICISFQTYLRDLGNFQTNTTFLLTIATMLLSITFPQNLFFKIKSILFCFYIDRFVIKGKIWTALTHQGTQWREDNESLKSK